MDELEKKFEVGEEVVVSGYYGGTHIQKVKEITKAGNIKLENGMIFYPNGSLRGETSFHNRTYMYKFDEKWKKHFEKRDIIQKISSLADTDNLKKFDIEKLKKILEVLEK